MGMGSVGVSTLQLMLSVLPHPKSLTFVRLFLSLLGGGCHNNVDGRIL